MKDSSRNKKDWFGYLMNFVAVCLGIIITFAGQGLINRHSERTRLNQTGQFFSSGYSVTSMWFLYTRMMP